MALLIYPFGGSDLQTPGGPLPRSSSLKEFAHEVAEMTPSWDTGEGSIVWLRPDGTVGALMPILSKVLKHLGEDRQVTLRPILTDQSGTSPDRADADSLHLLPLLHRLVGTVPSITKVAKEWQLKGDPSDYKGVLEQYGALWTKYTQSARGEDSKYLQVATGTPAMSLAASVFAADPDMHLLYVPRGRDAVEMPLFHDRLRAITEESVRRLASRLEWAAVAAALEREGNGYTRLAGDHPAAERIKAARMLDAWLSRDFAAVTRGVSGKSPLATCPLFVLARVLQADTLKARKRERQPVNWPEVRSAAMTDNLQRLAYHLHRHESPGAILALCTFEEAASWRLLTVLQPGVTKNLELNSDYWEQNRRSSAIAKLCNRENKALPPVQELAAWFFTLNWVREKVIDQVRNPLVHRGLNVPRGLMERRLRGGTMRLQCPDPSDKHPHPALDRLAALAIRVWRADPQLNDQRSASDFGLGALELAANLTLETPAGGMERTRDSGTPAKAFLALETKHHNDTQLWLGKRRNRGIRKTI